MLLAGCQHKRYRLAFTLTAYMYLGREPSLAAAQGFCLWVPPLHRLHADVLARRCYLHSGWPTLFGLRHLPGVVTPVGYCPTLLPASSGRSGWIPSSRSRSVQASRAREHLSSLPRVCRSALFANRCLDGPLSVSAVGAEAAAVPTAHRLAHVFVP